MITDNNSNEIIPVSTAKVAGVRKVEPVQVADPLPDGGKELPFQGNKAVTSSENSDDAVEKAVKEINDYVQVTRRELQFTLDKESGKTIIRVIDSQTQELIRQIPGDEAIRVAKKLGDGANLEIFNSYT